MLGETCYAPVATTGAQTAPNGGACDLGRRGEDAVAHNLEGRGWEIVARNWRTEVGEADIIARDPNQGRDEVTMIEVKTRRSCDPDVLPEEAVDAEKRRRYALLAAEFMRRNEGVIAVRFDTVGVTDRCNGRASLHHVFNSFGSDGR
ncbi:YraN family protein [Thermophilibacter sp.]